MKANYQNITSYGELCSASGQSIVECRLNGAEIVNVLASEARVSLDQAACDNGEIRYGGKLVVSFVYEDVEGKLCRAERGAEFFHKAEHPMIAPAHTAVGELTVLGVKTRREGGQLIAACIVEGKFAVLGEKRCVYVSGGEDVYVKQQPMEVYSQYVASAMLEDEDEFECEFAQDILLHTECACVTDARATIGQVDVGGELGLHFCMLRGDGSLASYERVVPFKAQILLDTAMPDMPCTARVQVLSAHVSAATDEERGKTKIVLSYRLSVSVSVYEKTEAPVCIDAYSTAVETVLKTEKVAGRVAMNTKTVAERIHGTPTFSSVVNPDKNLLAVIFPKCNAEIIYSENGTEAQGVIEAKALYKSTEGGVESVDVHLPFLFPVDGVCADADVRCAVYGFGLRVRAGGETEAEGTVKLQITSYEERESEYLSEITAGEPKQEKTCAISVYVPSRGDDLWTTAKRLSTSPEAVCEANPHLTFPLTGEERLLIYRQKREKLQK